MSSLRIDTSRREILMSPKDADDVDDDVITLLGDNGPCDPGNDTSPWQHSNIPVLIPIYVL